ncbi:ankyrin repeat domain-containing protein [Ignatzschineria rhizosphaerae]|uniref:Ankyrin repeat domain-containing protein n=1 Tax=Ignatzschineria rhizosphaerae TaxID=2923279 RepID=A0ABY3X2Y6_9GAMM|nr:ankyrin repeat domain-containing protein [Ignatzschineria rhizosphaerae]UNM95377.1 ankyrin repeat domain-containing protein [Ignatzschineria rhizosphaerae]
MKNLGIKALWSAVVLSLSLGIASADQAVDLDKFRFDIVEMKDIASPTKLKHRIFYEAPSTGENAAWFDAVKQGNLELIKSMVANGQDIEAKDSGSLDQTALGWAAFIGYEDIVDFLVAQGADLWATDKGDVYHVLKSAALGKNVHIVKKMHEALKDEYDINDTSYEDDGESLVMVAASNNRMDVVQYFIDEGADLNIVTTIEDPARFSYNQSALSYACQQGYEEMQQLLIKNGAVNHRTGDTSCQ